MQVAQCIHADDEVLVTKDIVHVESSTHKDGHSVSVVVLVDQIGGTGEVGQLGFIAYNQDRLPQLPILFTHSEEISCFVGGQPHGIDNLQLILGKFCRESGTEGKETDFALQFRRVISRFWPMRSTTY